MLHLLISRISPAFLLHPFASCIPPASYVFRTHVLRNLSAYHTRLSYMLHPLILCVFLPHLRSLSPYPAEQLIRLCLVLDITPCHSTGTHHTLS